MAGTMVLSLDVGTQSLRGMLIDAQGNTVHYVQTKYEAPYYSLRPGWAEQKPDYYFEKLTQTTRELEKLAGGWGNVCAVATSVMRDSCLCLDENRKPLRDIILWMDGREAEGEPKLPGAVQGIVKLIGMLDSLQQQYTVSPCNWLMQNEPDTWQRTDKFVLLSTYLNYQLTGKLIDRPSNVIGHVPIDYKSGRWQKKGALTRGVFDVPAEKLCELTDEPVVGHISREASLATGIPEGLPLIAAGSDKGCETLGLSVINKHQAALSFGTTATIQFATQDYFEPQKFLPAYPAVISGMYNPEIQIYRGYWLISWFKQEFAQQECEKARLIGGSAEELLNEHLADIAPGCDGLVLQPFWSPGVVTPNARGAIIGFKDSHTRAHIYRAIIEGIGFALMDGMYNMEKQGKQKITELFVAGGGAQSDEICQITADMFGLPVQRIQTHEAGALGAAMAAFVALGEYPTYTAAIKQMVRVKDVFLPEPQRNETYIKLYGEVYSEIYGRLEPLYIKLRRFARKRPQPPEV